MLITAKLCMLELYNLSGKCISPNLDELFEKSRKLLPKMLPKYIFPIHSYDRRLTVD